MNPYYNAAEAHRFVWFNGRVRRDSGLRDYRGFLMLTSLSDRSIGYTADPSKVEAVAGKQLEACRRLWGGA